MKKLLVRVAAIAVVCSGICSGVAVTAHEARPVSFAPWAGPRAGATNTILTQSADRENCIIALRVCQSACADKYQEGSDSWRICRENCGNIDTNCPAN